MGDPCMLHRQKTRARYVVARQLFTCSKFQHTVCDTLQSLQYCFVCRLHQTYYVVQHSRAFGVILSGWVFNTFVSVKCEWMAVLNFWASRKSNRIIIRWRQNNIVSKFLRSKSKIMFKSIIACRWKSFYIFNDVFHKSRWSDWPHISCIHSMKSSSSELSADGRSARSH